MVLSIPLANRRAIFALLLGVGLMAGGAVPYALSVTDGSYDYTVTLTPTDSVHSDVDASTLASNERAVISDAAVDAHSIPNSIQHGSTTAPYFYNTITGETVTTADGEPLPTGPIHESLDTTLDQPPKGVKDGDVVHVSPESNVELTAATGDMTPPTTYEVSVTKTREPLTANWLLSFCAGLFALALGLKKRKETVTV